MRACILVNHNVDFTSHGAYDFVKHTPKETLDLVCVLILPLSLSHGLIALSAVVRSCTSVVATYCSAVPKAGLCFMVLTMVSSAGCTVTQEYRRVIEVCVLRNSYPEAVIRKHAVQF